MMKVACIVFLAALVACAYAVNINAGGFEAICGMYGGDMAMCTEEGNQCTLVEGYVNCCQQGAGSPVQGPSMSCPVDYSKGCNFDGLC